MEIKTSKITNDNWQLCSLNNTGIALDLSEQFLNQKSNNGKNKMNCVLAQTTDDLYNAPTNGKKFLSDFVLIDVLFH